MLYRLAVENSRATNTIFYDVARNIFYTEDFNAFTLDRRIEERKRRFLQLRITLGLKCNYNCGYCSQQPIKGIELRTTNDIKRFTKSLKLYTDRFYPEYKEVNCSFWGGEPLVYLHDMERLIPELTEVYGGKIDFGFCTNGELYNRKVHDWVIDNNLGITVSHDGPGQFVRHKTDILDNPERLELIRHHSSLPEGLSFEPTFHKYNPSISRYIDFMSEKLGHDKFIIPECSYIRAYNDNSAVYCLSEHELKQDADDRVSLYHDGKADMFMPMIYNKLERLLMHMDKPEVPLRCLAHRQKNYVNVDMEGNLWSCHNNTGQMEDINGENLFRGNIYAMTHNLLQFSRHKKKLSTLCDDCLMKWICSGNCCLVDDSYMDLNCLSGYYQSYFTLAVAVNHLTGGRLVGVKKAV